ncbi:glutamate synthase family protein [Frankia casuarinae]|uniref:Ferredoxin-dependent glutamate synthase n=1 Tax=Frankia casuarinae (strain DSM 45818 / CECT 9043 / HFP020203 / CcI3) TaxID=106370 RepID=Q2J8X1_FRACC|nr:MULTISPECIES: FMN-binding glutamate synthase family protein [Frankia]ABD12271.1 ferredoxin-dependent glutamate synthase [Frankia casuarinae]ETA01730.1 glutamate synthase family protein [Frankia sp. CcI6]EYT91712.1 glutamate synthase family protein [Frankia casuarinae]OAA29123.1 glutamate synthase family protein [Frankia casuarinae]OHV48497.1 glutamate synthase [Frankia sp. CgIS1]
MFSFGILPALAGLMAAAIAAGLWWSADWWGAAAVSGALLALAVHDVTQRRHAILRNYPVFGHLRFMLESIRPEIQQYFIERNYDGRPFDRDIRTSIYERAKGIHSDQAFGTERDVNAVGYEYLLHSTVPLAVAPGTPPPRVRIGGPDCTQPYDMALLNISAMSFGALSGNAVLAMNRGAAAGGFAHDTGEGGLTEHHLRYHADLVWEIGSGYFGARTADGDFDPALFKDKAALPSVRMVELKLSQGAKPGLGGILPAAKVSAEIARARGVPAGVTCVSPPGHRVFSTPRELVLFIARMRELAGGKPTGFKLCMGPRRELLAICRAMLAEGITPDFIVVDGGEGGTGAAPLEYEDHVGTPLTEGLMTVHNALVGVGLRDQVRIGVSGKIATGVDIVKRLAQGADYTNAARAMMMAVGCIQAQRCHTNTCPVGVATQDPRRARAVDVADKGERVRRYQQAAVAQAVQMIASLGCAGPEQLHPGMLMRRVTHTDTRSYAELYEWLEPGELLVEPPADWAADWAAADPDRFRP